MCVWGGGPFTRTVNGPKRVLIETFHCDVMGVKIKPPNTNSTARLHVYSLYATGHKGFL